jgi:peptidoglycan/LPS O-acetylase OafA/YrhL
MSCTRRIPSLDGLRGVAAIAVMFFHFNIFFLPQARLYDLVPSVGRAYLAVDLFFLLSGFVMAHVYGRLLASNLRAHWLDFARARFARIYPTFVVTTLTMVILVGIFHTPLMFISFSNRSLALQPFLLQQWARGLSWDYPSWSISTEAVAYVSFVFSAGLLLTGKRPRLMAACCFSIVAALSIARDGSLNCFVGVLALVRTLAEFSLGALLYRAHSDRSRFPTKWAAIITVVAAGLAKVTHLDFLAVAAFGCLIYYSSTATDAFAKLLNSPPFVALGNWSYSIYLWHAPTHYAVMVAFAAAGYPVSDLGLSNSRLVLFATVSVVVSLSAFSYHYVEIPLRRQTLLWFATRQRKSHIA